MLNTLVLGMILGPSEKLQVEIGNTVEYGGFSPLESLSFCSCIPVTACF
jgi:hypothetical protein